MLTFGRGLCRKLIVDERVESAYCQHATESVIFGKYPVVHIGICNQEGQQCNQDVKIRLLWGTGLEVTVDGEVEQTVSRAFISKESLAKWPMLVTLKQGRIELRVGFDLEAD